MWASKYMEALKMYSSRIMFQFLLTTFLNMFFNYVVKLVKCESAISSKKRSGDDAHACSASFIVCKDSGDTQSAQLDEADTYFFLDVVSAISHLACEQFQLISPTYPDDNKFS